MPGYKTERLPVRLLFEGLGIPARNSFSLSCHELPITTSVILSQKFPLYGEFKKKCLSRRSKALSEGNLNPDADKLMTNKTVCLSTVPCVQGEAM